MTSLYGWNFACCTTVIFFGDSTWISGVGLALPNDSIEGRDDVTDDAVRRTCGTGEPWLDGEVNALGISEVRIAGTGFVTCGW